MTRKPRKPGEKAPKPEQTELRAKNNRQLTAQNRKLLGKHYAAKYGKRKGG